MMLMDGGYSTRLHYSCGYSLEMIGNSVYLWCLWKLCSFYVKKTEKDLGGKHIEITGNLIFIKVWQPCTTHDYGFN